MSGDSENFVYYVLLKNGEQKVVKPDNSSFTVTVTRIPGGYTSYYQITISNLDFYQITVNNRKFIFINMQQ